MLNMLILPIRGKYFNLKKNYKLPTVGKLEDHKAFEKFNNTKDFLCKY